METAEREDRFPGRGSKVLFVIAIVLAFGIVIALAAPGAGSIGLLIAIAFGANAAYLAWVGNALASGAPWARPVAIVALWAVAVFGIVDTLVALGQNRLNIPLGTILALFALAAPAGPVVLPADRVERQRAQTALVVGVVLVAVPWVVGTLLARGF
jgi:hypothetical protein